MTDAVLIAGPTASGKSAAAFALAEKLCGTVINADSKQVYRELAILTARPSPEEMAAVPHRLYGTVGAEEPYSVGRWLADAAVAIDEARAQRRLPILVGGTGLYFKTLLEGLAPVPDIPDETREAWREKAADLTPAALHRELAARDPVMAERLPRSDPQRLVRALEVIDATGVSLAEWQGTAGSPLLNAGTVAKLVIAPERETVYAAIDARFDRMLEQGALEEVAGLVALQLDEGLPVMRAHGVRALAAHLAGQMSLEDAAIKSKTETRQYAKRQMTWAKRFMTDWEWFPDAKAAVTAVNTILSK